jgi:putative tryptophan/tyrosine transport system substrate-binding protein
MNRRAFIASGAAAVATPLTAIADKLNGPLIGILGVAPGDLGLVAENLAAFRRGLGEAGYVEGRNVAIEYRWADNHNDRLPGLAADLVARKVDVIANEGGDPSALAAKTATSTVPIVVHCSDELMTSLIETYARPGGNLTGVTTYAGDPLPKQFEFLLELVPAHPIAVLLVNPNRPTAPTQVHGVDQAAKAKGVQLIVLKAGSEDELNTAFAALAEHQTTALVVAQDVFFSARRAQLVELASRYAVPTIYFERWFADAGGLISFGAPFREMYRLKGIYAGRILKGEKAADLPIIRPNKFELVINLKTAKALGLSVPQSLLARADEVIE